MARVKMTEAEKIAWDNLYQYVKKDVLGYTPDMKLSKKFVLRLKGLSEGKFCSNKKIQPMASYSFETILTTFKVKKLDIMIALRNTKFKNEDHKVNYLMSIIENSINDIVMKANRIEKESEKAEEIEINIVENKAEYKKKTQKKNSKILNDLW